VLASALVLYYRYRVVATPRSILPSPIQPKRVRLGARDFWGPPNTCPCVCGAHSNYMGPYAPHLAPRVSLARRLAHIGGGCTNTALPEKPIQPIPIYAPFLSDQTIGIRRL